jgi:signal transduction histidine kinase
MLTTAGLALSKERSPEEYRNALTTISVECEATSRLLEDLLAVARADIVHQKIEFKPVDLADLVQEVCQHFDARARLRDQKLEWDVEAGAWVLGDASLLRRMLTILIDNATKYTHESGAIFVSLGTSAGIIRLKVADNGIGIASEVLPKIFDRFYRVDESRNLDEGSSGLGLSIVKWVVEAHQFTIEVHSVPGEGSVFMVLMPVTNGEPMEPRFIYASALAG